MREKSASKNALLRLTLPLPPSINEQYATIDGHRVSTLAARQFKRQVRDALRSLEQQEILHDTLRNSLRQSYLDFFLVFYFTTSLEWDLDDVISISLVDLFEVL